MLTVGSRGSDVRALQQKLSAAGYSTGGADGIFGNNTRAAVVRYQRAHHLGADGVVGANTSRALFGDRNNDHFDGAGSSVAPSRPSGGGIGRTNREKLNYAEQTARAFGLRITSTTGGHHAPNSYHYVGRAVDVAGSPANMARFYRHMAQFAPTELFYDPMGGMKNGRNIGAIGGHRDHVHIAF